jgi:hypothetical protein
MNTVKERAKAIVAAVVPLLAVALITNIEKLSELDTAWKAVLIALVTSVATYIVPNQSPADG